MMENAAGVAGYSWAAWVWMGDWPWIAYLGIGDSFLVASL